MKAITLWQPWASAIALGLKRNETRDWPATVAGQRYRGWLAITAAKNKKDPESGESLEMAFSQILFSSAKSSAEFIPSGAFSMFQGTGSVFGETHFDKLPFGAIVCFVWLDCCVTTNRLQVTPLEYMWGNYGPDRWAWRFTECWRLNQPIPVRGERKLFELEAPANWQGLCAKVY